MKFISVFYAFLILLITPNPSLAANIELKNSPIGDTKQILVNVNTEGEQTKSIKVALKASEGVNISNIEEGNGFCDSFSSSPNGQLIEIMCTMTQDTIVDGTLAKIEFSSSTDDYTFTILEDQSQIGDLSINNVVNIDSEEIIGDDDSTIEEDSVTDTSTTETPTPVSSNSTGGVTVGNPQEKSGFKNILPYIFLGGAGLFLVSIIVLLITKKKDDVVLADVPASTTIVNAEAKASSEPSQDTTTEPPIKQSLDKIIKPVDITQPTETATQEGVVSENSDLQELLASEKSDAEPTQLMLESEVSSATEITSEIADNYQANITEDTLPDIGSTSPIDANGNVDTNVAPQIETGPQPEIVQQVENAVEQTDQTFDLGNLENTQEPIQTPLPVDTGALPQPEIVSQVPIENTNQQVNQAVDLGNTQETIQTSPSVTDFQGNENTTQQTNQIFDLGSTQEPIQAPQIGNVYPGDTSAFSQAESLLTDDNLNNPPTPPTPAM